MAKRKSIIDKHPGPWRSVTSEGDQCSTIRDANGAWIATTAFCEIRMRGNPTKAEEQTAQALALFPEQLAALKPLAAIPLEKFSKGNGPGNDPESVIMAWHMTDTPVELTVGHVLAARALIAEAEGKEG